MSPTVRPRRTARLAALLPVLLVPGFAADIEAQTADPEVTRSVQELAEHPRVRQAFDAVVALEPRTSREHIELTQIPAPPFMEEVRARHYAELLRQAGADTVWMDQEGNVLALRRGRGGDRTVAIGGHLDTVFPEGTDVTVQQRGDTLFAPGVGDDTRGLMVVLTVLRAMEEADVETRDDVLFVGVVGEEGLGDLRGMKHLFRESADPIDAWIEVDGGGIDRIVNKGLGSYRYRVTFKGPGGHSWGAFGLANPAHGLARATRRFVEAADTFTRSGPRTSYNVGVIGGGTSVNSIPFEAWMLVDTRSVSPQSLDRMETLVRTTMAQGLEEENAARRDGPPLEMVVEKIGDRPSGEVADDAPLVQRALASAAHFGAEPSLARSSTDSNIPISLGVPAVTIGRGGAGGDNHSPGEWWINRDGHLAIQNALLLLVAEAGLAVVLP